MSSYLLHPLECQIITVRGYVFSVESLPCRPCCGTVDTSSPSHQTSNLPTPSPLGDSSSHVSAWKQVCKMQSGTAQFHSPTEILCHSCARNASQWMRHQGNMGNGEWRQSRTQQNPLDDARSKMWVTECVCSHLRWKIIGSVSTHIHKASDRRLVTANPHYTRNGHSAMLNTDNTKMVRITKHDSWLKLLPLFVRMVVMW